MRGHGDLGLKFLLKFFFALNVPAKQGRNLHEKLRGKLRAKLRPELPPSKTETSPKTSLCRNPLLRLGFFLGSSLRQSAMSPARVSGLHPPCRGLLAATSKQEHTDSKERARLRMKRRTKIRESTLKLSP